MTSKNNINSEKKDIVMILLPLVLGICLCAACLAGTTFAWFSANTTTTTDSIVSAEYTVAVNVVGQSGPVLDSGSGFVLIAGEKYTVTLTATGTASTGYCVISLGQESFHTVPFPSETIPNGTMSFELTVSENTTMTVTPQWGSSSKAPADKWNNGETYNK